jgi:hypothetical protein
MNTNTHTKEIGIMKPGLQPDTIQNLKPVFSNLFSTQTLKIISISKGTPSHEKIVQAMKTDSRNPIEFLLNDCQQNLLLKS